MASVQELAHWIVNEFNPAEALTLERVIEQILQERSYSQSSILTELEKADRVLDVLQAMRPQSLPFEFSDTNERRLVGKQRPRKDDSEETIALRQRVQIIDDMIDLVHGCGNIIFERICAGMMRLSGAQEAIAICSNDEGGIDIYGRIPLRLEDNKIRKGLLQTAFLDKPFLFLGQCKCYKPGGSIEPKEISEFDSSVNDCLRKYEGNSLPPTNRVPSCYYRQHETCIRVFFTTASYSPKSAAKAASLDIVTVHGRQIAEFLVYHQIGLNKNHFDNYSIDQNELVTWSNSLTE